MMYASAEWGVHVSSPAIKGPRLMAFGWFDLVRSNVEQQCRPGLEIEVIFKPSLWWNTSKLARLYITPVIWLLRPRLIV